MHLLSRFHSGLLALVTLILAGCGGGGDGGGKAQIRLLNASTGYDSLDLYVKAEDDSSDTLQISNVLYGTVSDYSELKSDTYTVKFKRSGVTSTLATRAGDALTDDSHITYVAYGSSGRFATLAVDDDETEANSGEAKVRVLNAAEAGTLDVYLTDESVELDDASPLFGSVVSGGTASAGAIESGTYRLRVTGAGDNSDLRLDVPDISLESTQVITLVLTATQGGVLVNALMLPQQGSLAAYQNTKARIRGAVGIANGTAVTASAGGVSLLSSATVGVIGSRYSQVESGSVTVRVAVDGNVVAVPTQALAAGGDYTLLIWSDTEGTRTTLIGDDNRLPTTSGKTKIRLLNGMSGLGAPVSLSVDYSPIAEGIALGEASGGVEIDSGTGYQLDIAHADTGQNLLTRTSISLQSAAVYTMFMGGGGDMAVSGTLRKDR